MGRSKKGAPMAFVEPYHFIGHKAAVTCFGGNLRTGADLYRKATQLAPTEWAKHRYHFFNQYACLLVTDDNNKSNVIPVKADYRFLRRKVFPLSQKHVSTEVEPALFRVRASITLGKLYLEYQNNQKQAKRCYKRGLVAIREATQEERDRWVWLDAEEHLVGDLLDEYKIVMQGHLLKLSSSYKEIVADSAVEQIISADQNPPLLAIYSVDKAFEFPAPEFPPPAIKRSLSPSKPRTSPERHLPPEEVFVFVD